MSSSIYYTASEVSEMLGVSKGHAYRMIKMMNEQLKKKGFIVIAGRIPKRYFHERCYGVQQEASAG